MKVLLISPVRGLDPPCGDITYTEELLANMGDGVDYVTYDKAIADGTLLEVTRSTWHVAPIIVILNKLLNIIRKERLLFWEPYRFFVVTPNVYDVIHVHVFPFRILNKTNPIIYTAGAPTDDVYRDRRKYSAERVRLLNFFELILSKCFKVNHASICQPQVDCMAVYTEYFRDRIKAECNPHPDVVELLPISLADLATANVSHRGVRFGIVAYDFLSKGGLTLLEAFKSVVELDKDATLHIVGLVPDNVALPNGVTVYGIADREFILNEFLSLIDVFVYPTPHDCFSYVLLEAMRAGRAICTSDYVSMPEAVDYGNAGLISPVGDSNSLAYNMIQMLDFETRQRFQNSARSQFLKKFNSQTVLPRLYDLYCVLCKS